MLTGNCRTAHGAWNNNIILFCARSATAAPPRVGGTNRAPEQVPVRRHGRGARAVAFENSVQFLHLTREVACRRRAVVRRIISFRLVSTTFRIIIFSSPATVRRASYFFYTRELCDFCREPCAG